MPSGALVPIENWRSTTRSGRVAHDGGDVFLSIDPSESDRVERSWARHSGQGVGGSQSNCTRLVPTIHTVRVANLESGPASGFDGRRIYKAFSCGTAVEDCVRSRMHRVSCDGVSTDRSQCETPTPSGLLSNLVGRFESSFTCSCACVPMD